MGGAGRGIRANPLNPSGSATEYLQYIETLSSPRREKTCCRGFDQVIPKPACSFTDTSHNVETFDCRYFPI